MARYTKSHAMYESIKYEDLVLKQLYAITLSPSDQKELTVDRHKNFTKSTKQIMITLSSIHYKLHFEWSPLGIMHWHGKIRIFDKETWFKDDLYKLKQIGHLCIRPITNLGEWDKYCEKQGLEVIEHINWYNDTVTTEPVAPREIERSDKREKGKRATPLASVPSGELGSRGSNLAGDGALTEDLFMI